ncbi:MAG: YcgL domain-containing protein [Bacteroidales bacterium]|nr:YcgL domain-containing protein [Bacteroidales bacterium]
MFNKDECGKGEPSGTRSAGGLSPENAAPQDGAPRDGEKRLCQVYKGCKEEEMYLFVDQREGLDRVPPELLERFGETHLVTTLVLTPQRRLARAQAAKVLEAIRDQGFYLQMPPPKHFQRDTAMADLNVKNEKLPR